MTTLIIHAGGGKCGSTAIQNYLSSLTHCPEKCDSIFYGPKGLSNHTPLLALIDPKKYMRLRAVMPLARAEVASHQFLESLQGITRPKYIIISSEYFGSLHVNQFDELISLLNKYIPLSSARIIQYIRSPNSHYLSSSQQRIKADSIIKPFYTYSYDYSNLKRLKKVNCEKLIFREFSSTSLIEGDIIKDFFSTAFDKQIEPKSNDFLVDDNANKSLSAESLCALQIYNKKIASSGLLIKMGNRSKQNIRLLRQFETNHSQALTKASLQPFISTYLILSHMPALQQANNEFGVFSNLVNSYNSKSSPFTVENYHYSFMDRGTSFDDIRSILVNWDEKLAQQAFKQLSASNT